MAVLSTLVVAAGLASGAMASCAYGTSLFPRQEVGVKVNTFGYTGQIGPASWNLLDPVANIACSTGTQQTPLNMVPEAFTTIAGADLAINIPDVPEGAEFENLGTTVEVIAPEGASMTFNGTQFTLAQWHYHLPSEHLDNGLSMAMEQHMVFESADGQIAVIGSFIDIADTAGEAPAAPAPPAEEAPPAGNATEGEAGVPVAERRARQLRRQIAQEQQKKKRQEVAAGPTALLETVLGSVGQIAQPGSKTTTQPLVLSELVSALSAGEFTTYSGSLTTPPCSEGVRWLVSSQKLNVNLSTFKAARSVIGFNSRFPQNFVNGGQPTLEQALADAAEQAAQEPPAEGEAPAAEAPAAEAPVAESPVAEAPAAEAPAAAPHVAAPVAAPAAAAPHAAAPGVVIIPAPASGH